jgi:hypothetical protein
MGTTFPCLRKDRVEARGYKWSGSPKNGKRWY